MIWFRVIGVLLILAGVGFKGYQMGAAHVQSKWDAENLQRKDQTIKRYEGQIDKLKADLATAQTDSANLTTKLTAEQERSQRLQTAISRAKLVTNEPTAPGTAPAPRLSHSFRVCVNAAVIGTDEATADCEAIRVSAPAAP